MKNAFTFLALAAAVVGVSLLSVRATSFPPAWANDTINATLLTATTNQTGSAVFVESALYHTFQILNTTTRTNTVYLDRSLDGASWVSFSTNTFTNITSAEVTAVGKWSYVRGRLDTLTGTNCSVKFIYLGGK